MSQVQCNFQIDQKPLQGKQLQTSMAFMISNQVSATLFKVTSLENIQSISHALISMVLMNQITHARHSRLKNTDPKDTISLLQKHWNNAGQLNSQRSNTVVDAF